MQKQRVPLRRINGEVIDGLRWLAGHRYLRAITIWGGVFNIGSTACFSLLVLFALEVLNAGNVGYGMLLTVVAVGGLVGAAVAAPCARRLGRGRTILLGAAGSGLAVSAVGIIDIWYGTAALLFASGCLGAMVNVVGRALRQAMVPDLLLGRVTGGNRVVVYGAMPVGAGFGGWIARTSSLRVAFIVGGLIMAAISFAISPWLRERVIDEALEAADEARDVR